MERKKLLDWKKAIFQSTKKEAEEYRVLLQSKFAIFTSVDHYTNV